MTLNYSVCFKPVSPIFFGRSVSMEPYAYPISYELPPIYTLTGALLTILYEVGGIDPITLINCINNDKLKVYGVYLLPIDKAHTPYIPVASLRCEKELKPIRLIKGEGRKEVCTNELYGRRCIIAVNKQCEPTIAYTTPTKAPKPIALLNVHYERRVGISLVKRKNIVTKVPEVGGLYSKDVISELKLHNLITGEDREVMLLSLIHI